MDRRCVEDGFQGCVEGLEHVREWITKVLGIGLIHGFYNP
jgi:hypothetical protein